MALAPVLRGFICWIRIGVGLVVLGVGCLAAPAIASGQGLFLEGGAPQLRVDRFIAGQATAADTDASTTLVYEQARKPNRELKVGVSTSAFKEQFELEVKAVDPTEGTAQGWVRLTDGMPTTDLVRDIQPCSASKDRGQACEEQARLRYRLTASVSDGPGREEHVVRYTLMVQ